MAAMSSAKNAPSKDKTCAESTTLQGILAQPWAQGWQSQIQAAYASTIPQGSEVNVTA